MTYKTVKCRACGADIIFLPTRNAKTNPTDAETVEPGDTLFDFNKHRSHFYTCPKASEFRKNTNKKRKPTPENKDNLIQEVLLDV